MAFYSSIYDNNEPGHNIWYQSRSDPGRLKDEVYDAKNEVFLMEEKTQRKAGEGLAENQTDLQASDQSQGTGTYSSFRKIEFPSFDGDSPQVWVRKCQSYFQEVSISEEYKIPLASVYFCGEADLWYRSLSEEKINISWEEFISAVLDRFDDVKLVRDESDAIFVKEAEIDVETQVFDEMMVREVEEQSVVEEGVEVFNDMLVIEFNKQSVIEVCTNVFNEIREHKLLEFGRELLSVGKLEHDLFIEKLHDGYSKVARDVKVVVAANVLDHMSALTVNDEIEESSVNTCKNTEGCTSMDGKHSLHYTGDHPFGDFMIDPGGFIICHWKLELLIHLSFENDPKSLGVRPIELLRNMQYSPLVEPSCKIVFGILVEYFEVKNLKYGVIQWCSLGDRNMKGMELCIDSSYFIFPVPSHIDMSLGACTSEFQGNLEESMGTKCCIYSGSLNMLNTKCEIIAIFSTFDLIGIGLNLLKRQHLMLGLISFDEMSTKGTAKLFKVIAEIAIFNFTQGLINTQIMELIG